MNRQSPEFSRLTGRDTSELVPFGDIRLHRCVRPDWRALCVAASEAGFALQAASAWRSFDRQLAIWNGKARGERPVYDDAGAPLVMATLNPRERLFAILRYSALPGASRHHWGTDFDVIDVAAVGDDYRPQLVDAEFSRGGPFAALHEWLDRRIAQGRAFGFYRPYTRCCEPGRGLAPERWHLSHAPVAASYQAQCTESVMRDFYSGLEELELKAVLLDNFGTVFRHYIRCEA